MALNGLYCADVTLSNYSLTPTCFTHLQSKLHSAGYCTSEILLHADSLYSTVKSRAEYCMKAAKPEAAFTMTRV